MYLNFLTSFTLSYPVWFVFCMGLTSCTVLQTFWATWWTTSVSKQCYFPLITIICHKFLETCKINNYFNKNINLNMIYKAVSEMSYRFLEVPYYSLNKKLSKPVDIWSFHCGDNVKCGLVGYDIKSLHRQLPTFWNAASIFRWSVIICTEITILRKIINNMLHVRF